MTIQEAVDSLIAHYQDTNKIGAWPKPIMGVRVSTYGDPAEDVIRIDVGLHSVTYVPPEAVAGVGWQGYRCVAYRGVSNVVGDSGDIAP